MTDSVSAVGVATRSTDSVTRSYVRTYGRTNEESLSPSGDISPYVTRTRAYGLPIDPRPHLTRTLDVSNCDRPSNRRQAHEVPSQA